MTAIPDNHLPAIQWSVSPELTVRSIKWGGGSRRFQLVQGQTILACADLPITEHGRCVQEWNRQDSSRHINVKLFAAQNKAIIYSVVTDVAHRQLGAALERVDEAQWTKRLYEEEPNVDRNFFPALFSSNYLPSQIDWKMTKTDVREVWHRSNERSEVNMTRIYHDLALTRREERVVHACHASSPNRPWMRAQVIQRGLAKRVELLRIDDQREVGAAPGESGMILNTDDRAVYVCDHNDQYIAGPWRKPDHLKYLVFMGGVDLALVSHEDIKTYFQQICLRSEDVKAQYADESWFHSIRVTKEMHEFAKDLWLPTIHIHMSRTKIVTFMNFLESFLPRWSEARMEQERRLYCEEIDEDAIETAVAHPDLCNAEKTVGLRELDRAYDSTASVHFYLSVDRHCAKVRADQKLWAGYRLRTGTTQRRQPAGASIDQ